MENEAEKKVRPWPLVLEAALAITAAYLLWAHDWPAWAWALFSVFVAVIVVMNTLHRTGHMNERSYQGYKVGLGAALVAPLSVKYLISVTQGGSWWELVFVIALWWLVFEEFRYWRTMRRQDDVT